MVVAGRGKVKGNRVRPRRESGFVCRESENYIYKVKDGFENRLC